MTNKVVIVGSVNLDLLVSTARLPRSGETVLGDTAEYLLGGKGANQAVGSARAGAETQLFAAVGDDADGAMLLEELRSAGVDVKGVGHVPQRTGLALVVTSPADNQIVVLPGANLALSSEQLADLRLSPRDVCLTQRETPIDVSVSFFCAARRAGATTVLNVAPADEDARQLLPLTDIVVVNETEFLFLARRQSANLNDDAELRETAFQFGLTESQVLIVTLGADGAAIAKGSLVIRIQGEKVEVVDTTGAGDCFCGYLAAGLANGLTLECAVQQAIYAASLAVQRRGAANSIPPHADVAAKFGKRINA